MSVKEKQASGMGQVKAAAVLMLVLTLLTACGKARSDEPGRQDINLMPVEVAAASSQRVEQILSANGNIEAVAEVKLASKIPGKIARIAVANGSLVSSGQLLIQLEDVEASNNVKQAEAQLKMAQARYAALKTGSRAQERLQAGASTRSAQLDALEAERNYQRMQQLFDAGAISKVQLENAETGMKVARNRAEISRQQESLVLEGPRIEDLQSAQAAVEQAGAYLGAAREQLKNCYLTAPISGIIGDCDQESGDYVLPGMTLLSINRLDKVRVEVLVSQKDITAITPGLSARVMVDAFPDKTFWGKVAQVDPSADVTNRTYGVRIYVPNPEQLLKPGMYARVDMITGVHPDAVVIPMAAVQRKEGENKVFIVQGDTAKMKEVQLGAPYNKVHVEILTGIALKDIVVVTGGENLYEGAKVKVINKE